jgi:hypothetical protein
VNKEKSDLNKKKLEIRRNTTKFNAVLLSLNIYKKSEKGNAS